MQEFKITDEYIENFKELIHAKNDAALIALFEDQHHADIAEILDEIDLEDAIYVFKMLDSEKTSEILLELDEDLREAILDQLSSKEIAEELDELDTDDAADIIAELSKEKKDEVISELQDSSHAKDIVELLWRITFRKLWLLRCVQKSTCHF
jgi:magnesium transporter